jgi:hypothetical protein
MAKNKVTAPQISIIHSATEQLTGEYDTDGYPIYRKVLTGTFTATTNGTATIAHGITGLRTLVDYAWTMNLSSASVPTNSGQFYRHQETAGNYCQPISFSSTVISVLSTYAWGVSGFRLTIKYTKN